MWAENRQRLLQALIGRVDLSETDGFAHALHHLIRDFVRASGAAGEDVDVRFIGQDFT